MERSRQLQGVAAFVVQAEVQAPDLGGGIHTQAHQGIRQLQQDAADQVNEAPGGDDGDDLDHELPRVAVEQTVDAVDAGGGEQAGGKGPPGSAHTVDAHHVEGVVIAQTVLE